MRRMKALIDLNLSGNKLTELPGNGTAPRGLLRLGLARNRLTFASLHGLGDFHTLLHLDLSFNRLEALPVEISTSMPVCLPC